MMETEMVSEMLGFYPQLTWLVAQEDFIGINVSINGSDYEVSHNCR
jgi:hypothetical protein